MADGSGWTTGKRPFADRAEAGRQLAAALAGCAGRSDGIVIALPRGGVPVAVPVAESLGLPLDVLLVRKLGLPTHPELAMGAIASVGGAIQVVRNESVLAQSSVGAASFDEVCDREEIELRRRAVALRGNSPVPALPGLVVLVDDGLATGSTMLAAVAAVRAHPEFQLRRPKILVAVPVGGLPARQRLQAVVDDVVCLLSPEQYFAVGQVYRDFSPTSEREVQRLLAAFH